MISTLPGVVTTTHPGVVTTLPGTSVIKTLPPVTTVLTLSCVVTMITYSPTLQTDRSSKNPNRPNPENCQPICSGMSLSKLSRTLLKVRFADLVLFYSSDFWGTWAHPTFYAIGRNFAHSELSSFQAGSGSGSSSGLPRGIVRCSRWRRGGAPAKQA